MPINTRDAIRARVRKLRQAETAPKILEHRLLSMLVNEGYAPSRFIDPAGEIAAAVAAALVVVPSMTRDQAAALAAVPGVTAGLTIEEVCAAVDVGLIGGARPVS